MGAEGPDDADDAGAARVLVASLGGTWIAVDAEQVAGVVRPTPVTPVGGTPRWVRGVAAVRGSVCPVVDAAWLAAAPAADGAAADWWVLVTDGARSAALAGLRVWRVAAVAAPTGEEDGEADPAAAVAGLPAAGVARLAADSGRGAEALPAVVRRLDVPSLLDLLHAPTPAP